MSVTRLLSCLTAGLVALAGLVVIGFASPAVAVPDRDCSDFDTQRQAQKFYLDQGGPKSDPHRLDADDDGRACDSLPCPCGAGGTSAGKPKGKTGNGGSKAVVRQAAVVKKVVDGDTVRVRLLPRGGTKDVRLIGIDTPEVHGGTECWGPQASRTLKRILPVGTRVKLTSDRTQARSDRYGRLLRYVAKGKANVNRQQVFNGSARVYVYGGKPFAQVKGFRAAQAKAKAADRGLWGSCR